MLSLSALRCSAKLLTLVSLCASIDAFVAFSPSGIQPAAVSGMFSRSRPCPRCRGAATSTCQHCQGRIKMFLLPNAIDLTAI